MRFPRALAEWSSYLSLFPDELSVALGHMVRAIALAIGPMRSLRGAWRGEPDGFAGIARRGPYERLLVSEWALAEEIEEEFLRRAVSGEHLFLDQGRREPTGSRASLALFDAGPGQIGAPRLAHIAALIALARRAEAGGGRFGWGILQRPDMQVLPGVSEAEVLRLLEGRCSEEVNEREIEAWRGRLAGLQGLDDVWLVGSERLASFPGARDLSWLLLRDTYDPAARSIGITIRGQSSSTREMVLGLPEDKVCARILRDPFEFVSAEPHSVKSIYAPQSNLVFDTAASKLFARSTVGGIIEFPIPNSPAAPAGNPRHHSADRKRAVGAVGRFGKAIAAVTGEADLIKLEYLRRSPRFPPSGAYATFNKAVTYAPNPSERLEPCLRLALGKSLESQALVVDGSNCLFRLKTLQDSFNADGKVVVGAAFVVAARVLAVAPIGPRIVYVGKRWPGDKWAIRSIGLDRSEIALPFEGEPAGAFFGAGGQLAMGPFGLVAVAEEPRCWWILSAKGTAAIVLPYGWEAIGVSRSDAEQNALREPALIVLGKDGRTVGLAHNGSREAVLQGTLFRASSRITYITVSATVPYIAYSTVDGEVVVYSMNHRAALCRFSGVDTI